VYLVRLNLFAVVWFKTLSNFAIDHVTLKNLVKSVQNH
jgi:hypothetical protein